MKRDKEQSDDIFAGRGAPAFMSTKEKAIQLLREKYSESFAFTVGSPGKQVHLFLIKLGLWSLVTTLTPRDLAKDSKEIELGDALQVVEDALSGKKSELAERLDRCVELSLERIKTRLDEFKKSP